MELAPVGFMMHPCLLLLSALPFPVQEPEPPPTTLPELVITASRHEQPALESPRAITIVDEEELRRSLVGVAVDALALEPGVWVEHRTATTGDPVIRGLSGSNLLALIDGNTLSTFWGEGGFAGDDLYGKVDPWSLERIEVIRGPASVLYGSNALGGVIDFITRKPPVDFTDGERVWGGELRGNFATNGGVVRERADLWAANRVVRWRLGGDLGDWGDYRNGEGDLLVPTGGHERNLDWNSEFRLSDEEWLVFDVQRVHREPVYRYYRPTQWNANDRLGVNLEFHSTSGGPTWDHAFLRLYHQDKRDQRFWDDGTRGEASWDTWTSDLQAELAFGAHELTYGLAFHLDRGESPDDEQFTSYPPDGSGPIKPAPDSEWWNFGAFVQDQWALSDQWDLLAAARYDHFLFRTEPDAAYQPPPGSPPEVDDLRSTEGAATGGLALTRWMTDEWNVYASWFRGFRQFAPNFGIRKHGWGVLVPNGLLEPVTADSFELGSKVESETLRAEAVLYRTDFDHFQDIVAGTWQGSPFYDFDGDGDLEPDERVYRTSADGKAWVHGVELAASVRLDRWVRGDWADDFRVGGNFMWNRGEDETNGVPLRHTVPMRGVATVLWEPVNSPHRPYFEMDVEMVDAFTRIDPERLKSDVGYRRDPQDPNSPLIRPWGLPGYTLVHLRAGAELRENVRLYLAVYNLGDVQYRAAHSRADGIGRNVVLGLEVDF